MYKVESRMHGVFGLNQGDIITHTHTHIHVADTMSRSYSIASV